MVVYYLYDVLLLYVLSFNVSVADPWLLKFTDIDAEHFCAVLVKQIKCLFIFVIEKIKSSGSATECGEVGVQQYSNCGQW